MHAALLLAATLLGCPRSGPVESLPDGTPATEPQANPQGSDMPDPAVTVLPTGGGQPGSVPGVEPGTSTDPTPSPGAGAADPSPAGDDGALPAMDPVCTGTCVDPASVLGQALQALNGQYVAADVPAVEVTAGTLNVRSAPSTTSSQVLAMVNEGATFVVRGKSLDGEWYLVDWEGGLAWVNAAWTRPTTATPVTTPPDTGSPPADPVTPATGAPSAVDGLPVTGGQTPVRAAGGVTWWVSNDSPYHTATGGYRGINDTQARDYSSSDAAGQPVYSIGEGGVVVANVACTYRAFTCVNCAEQNRLVIVRYDNPRYGEEGEPRYTYAEYLHIQSDVEVGDVLSATEPFATIQTEGPHAEGKASDMSPHLHFSLFTSDEADVFTDWSVSDLSPLDTSLVPGVSAPTGTSPQAAVTGATLNVRDTPSTEGSRVLGMLQQGDVVDVTGRSADGEWYQIRYGSGTAWVYAGYTAANAAAQGSAVVP